MKDSRFKSKEVMEDKPTALNEENYSIEEYFKHLKKTIDTAERVENKLEYVLKVDFARNLLLYSALFFAIFYISALDRITNILRGSILSIMVVAVPIAVSIFLALAGFKRLKILKFGVSEIK